MIKYSLGNQQELITKTLPAYEKAKLIKRIMKKDATVWKSDPKKNDEIVNRLGWLDVADWMLPRVNELNKLAAAVKKEKISHVVLLGMGGSSLCPEVLSVIMGIGKGYPKFFMLDATDPEAVLNVESQIKLKSTLFIMSSKSGGTVETNSQFKYFYTLLEKLEKGKEIGKHFIAITDEGTSLQKLGEEKGFRKVFINPSNIGGRYSALSYFGMVPAALMGINVKKFLTNANQMKEDIISANSIEENPAVYPGIILGELAKAKVDKATFLIPGKLSPLGYWIEQLVAESTGKEDKGVIPVEGEQIASAKAYGPDRAFVSIQLKSEKNKAFDKKLADLKKAGFTVIEIVFKNEYDLAGEFYRWEIATAVMGATLNIDPFDQPNVQSAKDLTKKLLEGFKAKGKFKEEKPVFTSKNITIYADKNAFANFSVAKKAKSLEDVIGQFLGTVEPSDYLAFLAYLAKSKAVQKKFDAWRKAIQKKLGISTIQGYGPRYLHSIGQLYKGGQNSGLFIEFTIKDAKDIKVPGEAYTFGQLKFAQALGDYQALQGTQRRTLRVELGKNYLKDMEAFEKAFFAALEKITE